MSATTPCSAQKSSISCVSRIPPISEPASSGGPVFVPDARLKDEAETSQPLIVGMVLSQFRRDETIKMGYEERTIHHPLELSNILHDQFLRDTIALLPK